MPPSPPRSPPMARGDRPLVRPDWPPLFVALLGLFAGPAHPSAGQGLFPSLFVVTHQNKRKQAAAAAASSSSKQQHATAAAATPKQLGAPSSSLQQRQAAASNTQQHSNNTLSSNNTQQRRQQPASKQPTSEPDNQQTRNERTAPSSLGSSTQVCASPRWSRSMTTAMALGNKRRGRPPRLQKTEARSQACGKSPRGGDRGRPRATRRCSAR